LTRRDPQRRPRILVTAFEPFDGGAASRSQPWLDAFQSAGSYGCNQAFRVARHLAATSRRADVAAGLVALVRDLVFTSTTPDGSRPPVRGRASATS
jgi:pyrrolidone-carboxylate peptidase